MLTPPNLRTERLVLRALTQMDATDLHALHSDPVVHRYWDAPPWSDPARAERFLAAATAMVGEETGVRLAVVRQIDDQFLGWCGLSRLDSTHRSATLTCCLKVEAWGRGIATEAVGALLSWGFSHLDLHRVQAETDAENAAAGRVLSKLGFELEGRLREDCIVDGVLSDTAVFGLLEGEWHTMAHQLGLQPQVSEA